MKLSRFTTPSAIIKNAAIVLFALLPIFYIPAPWIDVLQSKMLIIAVATFAAAAAFAVAWYRERLIAYPRGALPLAALALPLVYVLSALVAGMTPSSFVSGTGETDTVVTMVLLYALFVLAALALRGSPSAITISFRALVLGMFALMLVQVFHTLVPSVSLGSLTAATASVFGTWHEVGILAGLGIFLVVALYDHPVFDSYWKWIGIALVPLCACMLLVVNMVDVWYVFGALCLLAFVHVWYWNRAGKLPLVRMIAFATLTLVAIACGSFAPRLYEALPAKLQVLQVEVRPSWQGTFMIGRESMHDARTALFGTGPNTFTNQWSLYKPAGVNTTEFWNVDFQSGVGFIPTTFVTTGLLGVLAWVFLFGALAWALVRFLRTAVDSHQALLIGVLFSSVLYLAAFHVLYVPSISLSALTFLLLGLIAGIGGVRTWQWADSQRDWKLWVRMIVCGIVLLAIAISAISLLRATVSDMLVNRSAAAYVRDQNAAAALELVQRALFIYANNDRAHRAAVELGLIRLGELAAAGGTSEQAVAALQVSLETTIQHGLAAVSINSGDYQNWLALASLYRDLAGAGVQGSYQNARTAYQEAYADNPQNPLPIVQLAQLEIAQNNLDEAKNLLDTALGLKADFAAAHFLRSQVHAAQGNTEAAILDATNAIRLDSEESLGWYNLGTIYFDADRFAEAAQALENAVALRNDYSNALYVLGLSYDELGRTAEALTVLERVMILNPSNTELAALVDEIRGRASAIDSQAE